MRRVGDALIDSLSPILVETGFHALPSFNETTWTRYPKGVGHITAHRDPSAYLGIIAVFTLIGEHFESGMSQWVPRMNGSRSRETLSSSEELAGRSKVPSVPGMRSISRQRMSD